IPRRSVAVDSAAHPAGVTAARLDQRRHGSGEGLTMAVPEPIELASPDDITLDDEFKNLPPALSPSEFAGLEAPILAQGCRHPLVLWRCNGLLILLDGHNRFAICRTHNIPFKCVLMDLADRAAARRFIVAEHLCHRNANCETASYLRGKLYLAEKQPHGG